MADDKKAARKGFAIMKAPEGVTGCSADSVEYEVIDGVVEVSERHVPHLAQHGFTLSGGK